MILNYPQTMNITLVLGLYIPVVDQMVKYLT